MAVLLTVLVGYLLMHRLQTDSVQSVQQSIDAWRTTLTVMRWTVIAVIAFGWNHLVAWLADMCDIGWLAAWLAGWPYGSYGWHHLQSFRKYVMETREQLRKCTWPTRDELYQHTVVVFLSTLMMGMFTVLADQAAALLVWDLLLQVPTSVFGKLFGGGV